MTAASAIGSASDATAPVTTASGRRGLRAQIHARATHVVVVIDARRIESTRGPEAVSERADAIGSSWTEQHDATTLKMQIEEERELQTQIDRGKRSDGDRGPRERAREIHRANARVEREELRDRACCERRNDARDERTKAPRARMERSVGAHRAANAATQLVGCECR